MLGNEEQCFFYYVKTEEVIAEVRSRALYKGVAGDCFVSFFWAVSVCNEAVIDGELCTAASGRPLGGPCAALLSCSEHIIHQL